MAKAQQKTAPLLSSAKGAPGKGRAAKPPAKKARRSSKGATRKVAAVATPRRMSSAWLNRLLVLAGVGISVGALTGIILATNIADITAAIERTLGVKLFDPTVYFISELPADLQSMDVVWVVTASFVLSLVATLYPAWRAAHVAPAEVLRYE